ncbi:yeats family-domain-containing protein [Chlamydoabsidia padenii]|nr:yeats family-domain-containing protein [Chlamydoabsidia padenii]
MGNDLYQQVKISCESSWKSQQDVEGNTLRSWKVTLVAVDEDKEVPGKLQAMLDHVEYILHPTFLNPRRDIKEEPYLLKEEGWGEFDLRIMLHFVDDFAPREIIVFDLNFKEPRYSKTHLVTFSDVTPEVASYLESLKDIGKESSTHTNSKKKLPSSQAYDHGFDYTDDDNDPLSSTSSPAPALTPPSDLLTPQQEFDEISPLSQHTENGIMFDDVDDDDTVEDHVVTESDIKRLNPVHSLQHDEDTCQAWDIPEQFDMVELARRLALLSESQGGALYMLIQKHQTSTMTVDEKDDQLTMDLYSLGAPLLTRIWEFTESIFENDTDND